MINIRNAIIAAVIGWCLVAAPSAIAMDEWTMVPLAYKSVSPVSAQTVIKVRCLGKLPKLMVRIAKDESGTAAKDAAGNDIQFKLTGNGQIETIIIPALVKQLYLVVGKTITHLDAQPRFDMAFSLGAVKHRDFQTVNFRYLTDEFTLDLTTKNPGFPQS